MYEEINIFIIRNSITKEKHTQYMHKLDKLKFYQKRSDAQGAITYQHNMAKQYPHDCPHNKFWNNAEIVECKLLIPKD